MKLSVLCLMSVAVLSLSALAQTYAPAPAPGPAPGPGGVYPSPSPSYIDPCNGDYAGGYDGQPLPLFIHIQRSGYGDNVNVDLTYRGQTFWGHGVCDNGGINFQVAGYEHRAGFIYGPYGVGGLQGWEYLYGRPYAHFMTNRQ